MNRLINVDFPTLGLPKIATIGSPRSERSESNSQIRSTVSVRFSSVESIWTASKEGARGETFLVESISSRAERDAPTESMPFDSAANSASRRWARAAISAVRKTLRAASGQTTVPISRPSTTIPLSALEIILRCNNKSSARTSGSALMTETFSVTS